jgi:phosphoesterase RecJ-like protein
LDKNKLYKKISKIINENKKFLIITHDYPDGDSLGSQIALYQLLSGLKKDVASLCNFELPYQYSFLPDLDKIKTSMEEIDLSAGEHICFILDCADEKRMNIDFEKLRKNVKFIVNIDHHKKNSNFGDLNLVESDSSATAEIIYKIVEKHYKKYIDHKMALGIYVGILTDTGKFQYSNTSPVVHKIVGELLEFDISPSKIHKYIYENEPLARFKLIQLVFDRIRYMESSGLIYSYILENDFRKLNLPFSAQDGIITMLRSKEKAKVAALIKQTGKNNYKISLRTSDSGVDLIKVSGKFGGGGHRMAAGYSDKGSLRKVINNLKKAVKDNI